MTTVDVVILAAGKGTRMKSALPKVLHPVGGRPMIGHVVRTAQGLSARSITVVLGHGLDRLAPVIEEMGAGIAEQREQLGTGHAVQQALPQIPDDDGRTLVLYGDVPLIRTTTLLRLIDAVCSEEPAGNPALAVLTAHMDNPAGYGRIIRSGKGQGKGDSIQAIVEEKDATDSQRSIREINTGIMLVPNAFLHQALPALRNDNRQKEFYLTDLVAMANAAGREVRAVDCDASETQGVNDRQQLAQVERLFQRWQAEALMIAGVTIADPARIDVRGDFVCGNDTFLDINLIVEGSVKIGNDCRIGANVVLKNCVLADNVEIRPYSHIEGATVASGCIVGPFARLRPGANLAPGVHIGNFVEIKQADVGEGSKVNHLAYIGDAEIGRGVNIGAGTITCNYDGVNKSLTRISDGAFIGSNSALVAPVTVGVNATVGAGSVITADVPEDTLAVARGKQKNIAGWQRPAKKK